MVKRITPPSLNTDDVSQENLLQRMATAGAGPPTPAGSPHPRTNGDLSRIMPPDTSQQKVRSGYSDPPNTKLAVVNNDLPSAQQLHPTPLANRESTEQPKTLSPQKADPALPTTLEGHDATAEKLQRVASAVYLHGSAEQALGSAFDPGAFDAYLQGVLADAGNPRDPVERMLLEMLTILYHHFGRLSLKAAAATGVDGSVAYVSALAKITAEARRMALALEDYRASRATLRVVGHERDCKKVG